VGAAATLGARLAVARGERLPALLDLRGRRRVLLRALAERLQRRRERAGDREVGAEAAQRVAREERIRAEVDDLGVGLRISLGGDPWNVRVHHQDDVRILEELARVP